MPEQTISEQLIHSIQLAKDYVESNLPKSEKDAKVNYFFDCASKFSDKYGEEYFQKTLYGLGFSEYEVNKIVDLKNQSHLTDLAAIFFKEIAVDLSVNGYTSPLSKNKNWLSVAIVEADRLSDQYGGLIEYISSNFEKNQKAEFLAILDRYVAVSSQNPDKQDILRLFQNFNSENKYLMELFVKEINSFATRYSIDDDGNTYRIYEELFSLNSGGKLCFTRGQTRATDCVFEEIDGSKGLICATSETNTENQQQLFKFRKSLMKQFGCNVNCHIYCDSLVRHNEQKPRGRGRPSKSANVNIQSLDQNYIAAMNLVGAMQVFTVADIEDAEFFKDTLKHSNIQIYNNDGGSKVANISVKEKIELIEESAVQAFELIAANKEFWLTTTIAKDLQKKFLLDLCNTFIWLHSNDFIQNPALPAYAKAALSDYNLTTVVNLGPKERQLITSTKKLLGLEIQKIALN